MAKRKAFPLRIPLDLWEEISRWAADDLRSVNGQIEYVLRRAVEERRRARTESEPPDPPDRGASPR